MLDERRCYHCDYWKTDEDGYNIGNPEGFYCKHCDNDGHVTLQENDIVYVNVYSVTRHYGGPEEGGWWYNWDNCIETYPVKNKRAETILEELESEYASKRYGNIYSVLGGRDIEIRLEAEPKESETKERPYYC